MGKKARLSSTSPVMDAPTALFLAAICGQTYLQLQGTGIIRLPDDYEIVGTFQASGSDGIYQPFGFVAQSPHAAILAFRGTANTSEWLTDFMADQVDYDLVNNSGAAHRGFTSLYKSCRMNIRQLLGEVPSNKPLFITGHSLGGALATLAALDLAVNSVFGSPIVYTFASPRVGNQKFAEAYNKAVPLSFRIANSEDIVVHLPPIVYQDPATKTLYYYSHVQHQCEVEFNGGSFSGNHLLGNYFNVLAEREPQFAAAMCSNPIGWCPNATPQRVNGK